jgi:hypothetical protein
MGSAWVINLFVAEWVIGLGDKVRSVRTADYFAGTANSPAVRPSRMEPLRISSFLRVIVRGPRIASQADRRQRRA